MIDCEHGMCISNAPRTKSIVNIDCETRKGNIDDSDMHDKVAIAASSGVSPIVRLPGFTGPEIKRALDTGAQYVFDS